MKMTKFEKWFINRPKHATRAINRAEELLHFADIKEGQNFLEVGCGNGAVSKHVARKYRLNATGIDVDPEQVKLAQQESHDMPGIRFLISDATKLPFQDNEFDIVLSFGTMHHISRWLDALGEIKRVLRPKGYFIYFDLIFTEPVARFGRLFKHSFGMTSMPALNSFTQKNGLSLVHGSSRNQLFWHEYNAVYQSDQA